ECWCWCWVPGAGCWVRSFAPQHPALSTFHWRVAREAIQSYSGAVRPHAGRGRRSLPVERRPPSAAEPFHRQLAKPACVLVRQRTIGEKLDPTRRIDNDHIRSFFSRKWSVRIPLANPRSDESDRSGTSVITPPFEMTCSSWPTRWSMLSRTSFGITTWYFGETLVRAMRPPIDHKSVRRSSSHQPPGERC